MNDAILNWIQSIKDKHQELFLRNRVIEFGSLNINGSPRSKFEKPVEYIGLDEKSGEGVDRRGLCHLHQDKEKFDVVISTEMLEHDPYWDLSFRNMLELIKIGGSLIITFAGPNRAAHGQANYTPLDHYYRNVSSADIFPILGQYRFHEVYFKNENDSFLSLFCYKKF